MSGKDIIFDDKKINKSNFYKNKNLYRYYIETIKIDDIDVNKIIISQKEAYDKKAHLNTSLDIMTMMSLGHYV